MMSTRSLEIRKKTLNSQKIYIINKVRLSWQGKKERRLFIYLAFFVTWNLSKNGKMGNIQREERKNETEKTMELWETPL